MEGVSGSLFRENVILHSMEDAVPTLLFVKAGVFQMKESYSVILDPISGIIPVALVFASGLVLRKYRRKIST